MYIDQPLAKSQASQCGQIIGGTGGVMKGQANSMAQTAQGVRDTSPVEMALDQLQRTIEVGHEEMLELRERLMPVTDQGNEKAGAQAGSSSPQASMPSQIEGRIAHMIERAVILQGSLREMRISLRI